SRARRHPERGAGHDEDQRRRTVGPVLLDASAAPSPHRRAGKRSLALDRGRPGSAPIASTLYPRIPFTSSRTWRASRPSPFGLVMYTTIVSTEQLAAHPTHLARGESP